MRLEGKKIAVLVAEGFEELEYWVTVMRLQEEGTEVVSVGPGTEPVSGKNGLGAQADTTADGVDATELDGVVVPGGWAPDKLRRYPEITNLVRTVHERNKTVGIICHGGLVAISAGIVAGARATGSLGIKDDLENAGAIWVDKAAFREGNLVWGRVVPDIPDFCRELVAALAEE
jgi:protease I